MSFEAPFREKVTAAEGSLVAHGSRLEALAGLTPAEQRKLLADAVAGFDSLRG